MTTTVPETFIEERRETIDAQLDYLRQRRIPVVMLPRGSTYVPEVPAGMRMVTVLGHRFIFNPVQTSVNEIEQAVAADSHGELLGHVWNKMRVVNLVRAGMVVTARNPAGTVIQDSVAPANSSALAAQCRKFRERFPDAQLSIRRAEEVLRERMAL